MNKEDKELLLKDLSVRLPYGIICHTEKGDGHLCSINQTIFGTEYGINIKATKRDYFNDREEVIKPYLRPMSSMTEKEWNDYKSTWKLVKHDLEDTYEPCIESFDWLNANHFDYRGLIPMSLAIKVTEENNPYK